MGFCPIQFTVTLFGRAEEYCSLYSRDFVIKGFRCTLYVEVLFYKDYKTNLRDLQHCTEGNHTQNKMDCYWFHFLCLRNPDEKEKDTFKPRTVKRTINYFKMGNTGIKM